MKKYIFLVIVIPASFLLGMSIGYDYEDIDEYSDCIEKHYDGRTPAEVYQLTGEEPICEQN